MKDCMFQYATRHKVLADTDLIHMEKAKGLFDKNREDYTQRLENGEDPEMAIWIECSCNTSYGQTLHHWCAEDFKVIDGELIIPESIGGNMRINIRINADITVEGYVEMHGEHYEISYGNFSVYNKDFKVATKELISNIKDYLGLQFNGNLQ